MQLSTTQKTILYTLVGFAAYSLFKNNYLSGLKSELDRITNQGLVSYILAYLIIGLPLFTATYIIANGQSILSSLGLKSNLGQAILVSLLFAAPMLLGGKIINGISDNLNWQNVAAATIVTGFIEELYYRGFLFSMLYKYTRMGFLLSVLSSALFFALAHMYQSDNPAQLLGILAITFMGGGLFAWLYVEWGYNLWVPFFLHTFINLAWQNIKLRANRFRGMDA